ncbi:MAG TPA: FxsA family protein [Streptosporangiaceae bacterium]|jgi:UPF0716 protein FxsA
MLLVPLLALIGLAAVEIYVFVVVAHAIGVAWTVAALLASTVAGLWLARAQGRRAGGALREAMMTGAIPDRELGDAALIFAGGALIAIPGFVTDAVGLLAVAPVTRPAVRRLLGFILLRRAAALARRSAPAAGEASSPGLEPEPPGKVVRGEVIDDDRGTGT